MEVIKSACEQTKADSLRALVVVSTLCTLNVRVSAYINCGMKDKLKEIVKLSFLFERFEQSTRTKFPVFKTFSVCVCKCN